MVGARLRQLREIQTSPLLHGVRPAAPDLPTDGELKPNEKKTLMIGEVYPIQKKGQKLGPEKKKVQKIPSPTSPENMFTTRPGRRAFFLGSRMDPDAPISHHIS